MAGNFLLKKFEDINFDDELFNSLKSNYPKTKKGTGFIEWVNDKLASEGKALVFEDETGLGIFASLEQENKEIELKDCRLPKRKRIKISMFCVSKRYREQSVSEGAVGLMLWKWQQSEYPEIYITIFDRCKELVSQFESFGFQKQGTNLNGESVYLKCRDNIDFSNPYKSFPFIRSDFNKAGYIIIDDNLHDRMFAYAEPENAADLQNRVGFSVSNGLSKVYMGAAPNPVYKQGEPVLIYRKYTQGVGKRYRSCITSFCVITDIIKAKSDYHYLISFDDLLCRIGNKTIFDEAELREQYERNKNVTVIEMLYYGSFDAGNHVNMDWLDKNGCWARIDQYPADIKLSSAQFEKILMAGKVNVSNVIIDS